MKNPTNQQIINIVKTNENFRWHTQDYLSLIIEVLSRIDDFDEVDDDSLMQTIDDTLIYYDDQWIILKEWCIPTHANFDNAFESFYADCEECVDSIKSM